MDALINALEPAKAWTNAALDLMHTRVGLID